LSNNYHITQQIVILYTRT